MNWNFKEKGYLPARRWVGSFHGGRNKSREEAQSAVELEVILFRWLAIIPTYHFSQEESKWPTAEIFRWHDEVEDNIHEIVKICWERRKMEIEREEYHFHSEAWWRGDPYRDSSPFPIRNQRKRWANHPDGPLSLLKLIDRIYLGAVTQSGSISLLTGHSVEAEVGSEVIDDMAGDEWQPVHLFHTERTFS